MAAQTSSVATQSVLRRFIDSPAGPKTIHFWAPAMKWVKKKKQKKNPKKKLIKIYKRL